MKENEITCLTDEQRYALRSTLDQIWDTIGEDVLSLETNAVPEVSRYDVAEMCLDADRWRDSSSAKEMIEVMAIFHEWGWMSPNMKKEIEIALPYNSYGY